MFYVLCFQILTYILLHLVSYFFFLYRSPLFLCTVFDSISSKIHEVLLMNPSANAFVFGDFNVHNKTWLAYSGGTDTPDEVCFFLYFKLRWLTLLGSQTVILKVLLFGFIYYF